MKAKELEELVEGVLALYKAGKGAMADGKLGLDDLAHLLAAVPKLQPAIEGVGKIPSEVSALKPDEKATVVAKIVAELAVDHEKAAAIAQEALQVAYHGYKLVKAIA